MSADVMTDRSPLTGVPLFRAVPLDDLSALTHRGEVKRFATGEVLMRQDEPSDCLHIILHGKVRVERSHPGLVEPVLLAELEAGTTVGEMGVLDSAARSATVTAVEETETFVLGSDALSETLHDHPHVANALLEILSRRLRSTGDLAAQIPRQQRERTT